MPAPDVVFAGERGIIWSVKLPCKTVQDPAFTGGVFPFLIHVFSRCLPIAGGHRGFDAGVDL